MQVMHISIYIAAGSSSRIPVFQMVLQLWQTLSAAILSAFLVTACQMEETHLSPFLRKERIRLLLLAHMHACVGVCINYQQW
jgi:hypothetical protein